MPRFERSFSVDASLHAVADFHASPQALRALTPPFLFLRMRYTEPLAEGSRSIFRMWLGPIPVDWEAQHEDVRLPDEFADVMRSGPFLAWRHTHRFRAITDRQAQVTDAIEASFGTGVIDAALSRLMWWGLPILFRYRAWATRRAIQARSD